MRFCEMVLGRARLLPSRWLAKQSLPSPSVI